MAVPKRKVSKTKVRTRRAAQRVQLPSAKPCPQCGAPQQSHRVCASCGFYRGRQVIAVQTD